MISWQEALIRLLVALLFCGAVGVERFLAGKAAGVRTHIMVGMGSALFTLISGYAFHATASNADRIAAQVVSGIGFIGGGAILREGTSIRGLTTAAGLWAVAALGMAAGTGMYAVGAMGTGIILLTLIVLHRAEVHLPRRMRETWVLQVTLDKGATAGALRAALSASCDKATLEALELDEAGDTHLTFTAEAGHGFDIAALTQTMRAAGARAVLWRAHEKADIGA